MSTHQEEALPSRSLANAFDVVAIAASLGGLHAISQVLSALPSDFPAALIVVQHLHPSFPSFLVDLLSQRTKLVVKWAEAGDRLQPGIVYVAPPNHHVQITKHGRLSLSQSARVQWSRPSADILFESVATGYGERAIGVILTGAGRDGARGAQMIKQMGGRILVQDMVTSKSFGMPGATIKTRCMDFILPLNTIAHALIALVMVKGAATFFRVRNYPLSYSA